MYMYVAGFNGIEYVRGQTIEFFNHLLFFV